jgi:hypothetical protein
VDWCNIFPENGFGIPFGYKHVGAYGLGDVTGSDGQRVAQVPPGCDNGGNQDHTSGAYRSLYPGFHFIFPAFPDN